MVEYENLAKALSLALSAQGSVINCCNALSAYLDAIKDPQRTVQLCETVITRLERYSPDKLTPALQNERTLILGDLAKHLRQLRRYQEAEASCEKILALVISLQALDDKEKGRLVAMTYYELGMVAQVQRHWGQAEEYYLKALEIDIEFEDRYSQASTYHQLGMVAEEQRQWGQAEEYSQKALQIKIEFNDRHAQASTYHNLGAVAQEQRQWKQAEEYYQKALQIHIGFNDRHRQAMTYHQLGMVAQEQRQWKQAEEYYQKALQINIEFNDRHAQASTYHQLGRVAQEQRQWKQAEEYYQKALQIYVEFDDRYSQASTYHQFGRVAEEQERWAQAREYFLRGLEIDVSYRDGHNVGIDLRSLARLWQASGDASLPAATGPILNISPEEAEYLLRNPPAPED